MLYEELVYDYDGTLLRVLDGIGVPENYGVARPRMRRRADELSEAWVHLYNERKAAKTVHRG